MIINLVKQAALTDKLDELAACLSECALLRPCVCMNNTVQCTTENVDCAAHTYIIASDGTVIVAIYHAQRKGHAAPASPCRKDVNAKTSTAHHVKACKTGLRYFFQVFKEGKHPIEWQGSWPKLYKAQASSRKLDLPRKRRMSASPRPAHEIS